MSFLALQRNVYSQCGEDGIVSAILAELPETNGWCVEFGAMDGIRLSNSRHLIESRGYRSVLIEPDDEAFAALRVNSSPFPGVTVLQTFVGFSERDGLDSILDRTECPHDFDFLSIDVDGIDIHVWRAIERYRPKVVCIEYNPTIPPNVIFAQPADATLKWGCSLAALVLEGRRKGYELVCANELNGFFVPSELLPLLRDPGSPPEVCHSPHSDPVYVFSGYDGTLLLSREIPMPWHGTTVSAQEIQLLPSPIRKYPADYTWIERRLAAAYGRFRRARKARRIG